MAAPNRHYIRKHSTEARDPGTKSKIQVYVWTCTSCGVTGSLRSRSARDRKAAEHEAEPVSR